MSPAEIDARLTDRFRLLTGRARSAIGRQQTLLAAVDWSWELLDDGDRRLLARLDLERARRLHAEALAIVRDLVGWSVPHTLVQLACAEARLGELDAAEAHLAEAAGLLQAVPQPATAAYAMVGAALVAVGRGRPGEAARLLATAEAVRERSGFAAAGAERHEAELAAGAVEAALDPDARAAARAAGQALAMDAALRDLVASA